MAGGGLFSQLYFTWVSLLSWISVFGYACCPGFGVVVFGCLLCLGFVGGFLVLVLTDWFLRWVAECRWLCGWFGV